MNWTTTAKKRFGAKRKSGTDLRQQYNGNKRGRDFVPEFEVRPTPIIDPPDCMTSLGRLSFHSVHEERTSSNRVNEYGSGVSNDLQMLNNPMISSKANKLSMQAKQKDEQKARPIASSSKNSDCDMLVVDPLSLLEISPIKPIGVLNYPTDTDFDSANDTILFFNDSQECEESGLPPRAWAGELEPSAKRGSGNQSPPSVAVSVSADDALYVGTFPPSFDSYCKALSAELLPSLHPRFEPCSARSSPLAAFAFPSVFSPESDAGDTDDCISLMQF